MNLYKFSLVSLFLIVGGFLVPASALNNKNSGPFQVRDTLGQIAHFLGPKDITNLRLVSKVSNKNTDEYLKELASSVIQTAFKMNQDIGLSKLLQYQNQNLSLLEKVMGNQKLSQELTQLVQAQMEKEGIGFLLRSSSLEGYIEDALMSPKQPYAVFDGADWYKKYKPSIDQAMFGQESDESYKEAVAHHLLSELIFYVSSQDQATQILNFWQQNQLHILGFCKEAYQKNHYIKFADVTGDLKTDHHIVITDKQMANEANKEFLEQILQAHPSHRLVLNVGDRFVRQGVLKLTRDQIPKNLAHLIICNTQNNVTTIGRWFLYGAESLTSFDTRRLENVTTIGNGFLNGAESLTSFDTCGLKKVVAIGRWFLCDAVSLTLFDTRGLENVTTIGKWFLQNARSLQSCDARGLGKRHNHRGEWLGDTCAREIREIQKFLEDLKSRRHPFV
jgi:hypothetical protein